MAEAASLPSAVRCPGCSGPLRRVSDERLDCGDCGQAYPVHAGIPWLFRDVEGARGQWAAKLQQFRTDLLADHAATGAAAEGEDLLAPTGERLARQKAGLERLGEQVFGLLEPFAFAHAEAGAGLPRDRIPSRQHVTSYLETAFRDWGWGEAEHARTREIVAPLMPDGGGEGLALVLGGGAGRFAWELAREGGFEGVVQLDLNPLLTRIARQVCAGEAVPLTELPRFPRGLDHVAVDQRLARPDEAGGGDDAGRAPAPLHFLLGDVFAPPLATEGFALLATPWLVDILPESFRRVARRLGALLEVGGRWIGFGPLSFETLGPAERFTPEEMQAALGEAGFDVDHVGLERVDYLHSPHGLPRRGEEIFVFAATRREKVPVGEPFSFYPEWLLDGGRPIPALPALEQLRAERVFDAEILKCVDGRASIEDVVATLCARYGLAPDRCRASVDRFFSRWVEGETGGRGGG